MLDEMFAKQPGLFIPVLAIVCGTIIAVVAIIAHEWRSVRVRDLDAALKQDMLNQGMSPEDIERVLLASSEPPEPADTAQETISDNEYYLVEKMVEEGRSAEEIERIIKAFKSGQAATAVKPKELPVS